MVDMNKQALEMWNSMKPMIDREIEQQTKGTVQRRKAKVTTAPSIVTKKIGVTEPFGDQYFIPYDAKVAGANVGDVVWVEYMYGASNAFASMFAKAVEDPRSCSATLSSAGWYRVMQTKDVSGTIINFYIGRPWDSNQAEAHKISFYTVGGDKSAFLNETSDTNTLCVDKIRATYGGGLMYFDVHYNASSANEVLVYFDVYGKGQANGTSIAMGLASVSDAPSGETILAEYEFVADTQGYTKVSIPGTFTAQANTTLASISVPKGRKAIEACVRFRSTNSTGKMLIGLGNTICTVPDGEYQAVTLVSPITTETTIYVICYVYNSSSVTTQGLDNCVLYRFI